ncbi:leptin receptor isoform X1 [Alligator mississippiensis]|uniref:leptin receptor isoform X1 n=1 Tax=Alligator mississippiensis TaxID=8496 RepID=UPI0007118C46|nr:leptin receptor isoform X1 [Alligator mississippiensis]
MYWQKVLTVFLHLDFLQMAVAHCLVHHIPPWSFMLPCMSPNETSIIPVPSGVVETNSCLNGGCGMADTNPMVGVTDQSFLCCLWNDININCSLYKPSTETKSFISTEISVLASLHTDLSWNTECWTKGDLEQLVCILKLSKSHVNGDLKVHLLYALSDLLLEDIPTSSLKGNYMVSHCACKEHDKYECHVPSLKLSYTYILWLKITNGATTLQSPLLLVTPINIVKPEPPLNLQLEMTDKWQVKIYWSSPVLPSYALQYEVKFSVNSTQNTWQVVKTVLENSLTIDDTLLGSSYLVQVRCKRLHGLGFWSEWSTSYSLNTEEVMYFPRKILTSVGSNVSFHCIYINKNQIVLSKKIVWWLNLAEEIPESQYTLVNDHISKVTLFNLNAIKPRGTFFYNALYCCHQSRECHHRYAELYVVDVNINITCETDGYLTKMTCRWSANTIMLLMGSSLQLRYYRSSIYCSDFQSEPPKSEVKECHLQGNHSYECTFQPIFLLSGYTMWIEIKHLLGTLQSPPTCVIPADVVKPFPPSSVKAEITKNVGLLNVSWTNPAFATIELKFQIQYAVKRKEITWETYEVSKAPTKSVLIKVPDLCVVYIVQVRCIGVDGVGYWSDWSKSAFTVVKDVKAPLKGPEFWRIITEDPIKKQKNITLFWKPLIKNYSLCSVSRYMIEHRTSENMTWSEYVDSGTTYTFPWTEQAHTITILAINSVGASLVNFYLPLSQQMSTVNMVQSLAAYPVNSSCVILTWTLSPPTYMIKSFVIEWKNLNEEEGMKWMHLPPNISKCYIYDHFILIQKYQFSLYPIFPEGVGKPKTTDQFIKDENEKQNNVGLYMILPIVILSSVLLLGMLLISHQRMKKLFWEDVPNPKNCSWAQGVNFQKPETFEHLFIKHPGAVSFGPLLLEPEIVLEDISVAKALKNEDKQDFFAVNSVFTKIQDSEHDSACSSSHFNSNSLSGESHDGQVKEGDTRQSNIKYATIISNSKSNGLYEQQNNLSSSFVGCFPGEDSLVTAPFSSSSWEVGNDVLLVLPDQHPCQPSKTLSLSRVSSEGFSEPSNQDDTFPDGDSPERSLYYLGLTSIKKKGNDIFLTENSRVMPKLDTHDVFKDLGFFQDSSSNLNPFIKNNLKYETSVKTFIPYMPQFQSTSVKLQEMTENKT